jgi:hypothetical protein
MPGCSFTYPGRFAEYGNTPKDKVSADQLFDHIQNFGYLGKFKPVGIAFYAVASARFKMRAEDEIGREIGVMLIFFKQFLI